MTITLSSTDSGAGDSTRRSSRQRSQPNRLINDTSASSKRTIKSHKQQTSRDKAVASTPTKSKSRRVVQEEEEEEEEDEEDKDDQLADGDDSEQEQQEDDDNGEEEEDMDDEEEQDEDENDAYASEDADNDDADDSDFEEAKSKPKKAASAKSTTPGPGGNKSKGRGGRPKIDRIHVIRRPKERATAGSGGEPKPTRGSKSVKSKASAAPRGVNRQDDEVESESPIYDAILDSQVALDTEVTQWCEKYEVSSQAALLELVNLLIRSCGCTQLLTENEFEDQDMMVEALEDILVRYKESTTNFDYPIVSKAKQFKKFKKNLIEFYVRLIRRTQADILYDGTFVSTLLAWTISLSSTTFRPFRHTASVVALNIVTSLVEIASDLDDELNTATRQLSAAQKSKASVAKISQLRKAVNDAKGHKTETLKWVDEIFDSVFVMRCRDVDPLVRVECVHELGVWMAKYPDYFISASHLRYLGWLVTDKAASVRAEALKAFAKLYELDHHHANTLRQTITRFMERLVGLALGDTDLNVRLGAIRLLALVDQHGQLEEEDQALLSTMIFCTNTRIRKAMAKFVKTRVAEDEVAKRMAQCEIQLGDGNQINKDWIELKSLSSFLIKVGKQLAAQNERAPAVQNEQEKAAKVRMIDEAKTGRVALAIEALWSDMEILKDWKTITEYLVQDHTSSAEKADGDTTTAGTAVSSPSSSAAPAMAMTGGNLAANYRLEEEEEAVLLEVLVASIQLTLKPPAVFGFQKDKAKTEAQLAEAADEVGRYLVNTLPQLFLKYGVDENGIQSVLTIPQLFPLSVYVDLRMVTTYEELVADVVKVYKKHVHSSVLSIAARTLRKMQEYEMLKASNEAPFQEICTWVLDNFLVLCPTADQAFLDAEDRETIQGLSAALTRFEHLVKNTDMTLNKSAMVQREVFDGLLRVIRLGGQTLKGSDAEMVMSAMSIGFLWISWLCRGLLSRHGQEGDWTEAEATEIKEMRDTFVRVMQEMALFEMAQTVDSKVRRKAFQTMGDLYWLFGSDMFHTSNGYHRHSLWLRCDNQTQNACEQFIRTELELWDAQLRELMAKLRKARRSTTHSLDMHIDDNGGEGSSSSASNMKYDEPLSDAEQEDEIEQAALAADDDGNSTADKYEMFGTVFSYMRQLILKDLDMKHAVAVVSQYGRFGGEYDEGVKRVVSALKGHATEGQYASERLRKMEEFMSNVCIESLKESYETYMDNKVRSFQTTSVALAKVLTSVITPPGFMKTKRSGVAPRLIWEIQRQAIRYAVEKMGGFSSIDDSDDRIVRMVGFFEVIGHLLFGIHADPAEVKKTQELLQSELQDRSITVREDQEWEPLRVYQVKLDKMLNKATAEQAAVAAKVLETDTKAEAEKNDVEMADVTIDNGSNGNRVEESTPPPPSPTTVRKRHLMEVDEEEMTGDGHHHDELSAATGSTMLDATATSSTVVQIHAADSDNESVTSQGLSAIRKETKRLKLGS